MNYRIKITARQWGIMLASLIMVFVVGCEKQIIEPPAEDLQLDQSVKQGLVSGWQTIHSLNSVNQVNGVVSRDQAIDKEKAGGIYSTNQLQREFQRLHQGMAAMVPNPKYATRTAGDSLFWFVDYTDPVSGVSIRKALYYDRDTGHARYYEVIYAFPPQVDLKYDSTEIAADLNFTLNDTTDDRVLSLYKLSEFRDGFPVVKIQSDAQVTDYGANNEVTGAILHNNVWYSAEKPK